MPSPSRGAGSGCEGQHLAEYAVVIGLVVAALMAMQLYVKRGLQARYRTLADGAMRTIDAPSQYEPYYASSSSTTSQETSLISSYSPGGSMTRNEWSSTTTDPQAQQIVGVELSADDAWE
ncbi:MAG: hypothetical protein HYY90_05020 [Candidatus Omnitrophica bacterium]|nr:hypothetical protein [Candidatus Omnitrophota bacterium]MBI3020779.1 hypothetical protein [Candidatus Omnitrophota bacterium]MBI3083705.1 hypothetical protein [Candidatus Omnitrophota bacterium]